MIEVSTRLSPAQIAHTDANLELVSQFIQELLDLPEDAGAIPEKATVILLPPDDRGDSELFEANMRLARKMAGEGKDVMLWTIGSGKMTALQDHECLVAAEPDNR